MKKHNTPLILIIDDEQAILQTLQDALTDENFLVQTLADGRKAIDAIGKLIPDLVLLDIFMPNCNGIELLAQIKKEYPHQEVMMISGYGNIPLAVDALTKGARDFIEKPINLDEILSKLEFLKETEAVPATQTKPLKEYGIIGESNLFLELVQQVDRVAPHTFPILLYGEHGTGKTTFAKYIHEQSGKENFVTINCETLSQEQANKTFTQAFDNTNKTIYLKHLEELTNKDIQKQLLSCIEQNKSARIISSARTSLFKLVQEQKFNSTLFFHLNRGPLEIPALRKRPYDIPLLVTHYTKQEKKYITLTAQAMRVLRNFTWTGNITQLKQAIEILIATSEEGNVITPEKLSKLIGEDKTVLPEQQTFMSFASLAQATQTFEKEFIIHTLKKNLGNLEQSAARLQLTSDQFQNKLLELKIDKQSLIGG